MPASPHESISITCSSVCDATSVPFACGPAPERKLWPVRSDSFHIDSHEVPGHLVLASRRRAARTGACAPARPRARTGSALARSTSGIRNRSCLLPQTSARPSRTAKPRPLRSHSSTGWSRDVAVAAEHLHRAVGDGERHVVGEALGEAGLARRVAALVEAPGGLPHQQPRGVDLDRHLGEHERDRLALGDRLAEGLCASSRSRARTRTPRARRRPPARRARRASAFRSGSTSQPASPPMRWRAGTRQPLSSTVYRGNARSPMFRSRSPIMQPARALADEERLRDPVQRGVRDQPLRLRGERHVALHAVQHVRPVLAPRLRPQRARVEVEAGLLPGGGAWHVCVAGEGAAALPPAGPRCRPAERGARPGRARAGPAPPATSPQPSSSQKSAPVTTERCPKPPWSSGRLAGRRARSQPAWLQRGGRLAALVGCAGARDAAPAQRSAVPTRPASSDRRSARTRTSAG